MLGKLKEARELIREARDTFEKRRAAILHKAFTGELTKKWRKKKKSKRSPSFVIKKSQDIVL
jgi:type I restriction enzyme S subunit